MTTTDAFSLMGNLLKAWAATTNKIVDDFKLPKDGERMDLLSHASRLEDSETMLTFGYIAKAEDKTGRNAIMQADIVNALVPSDTPDVEKERQKKRQAIKRRVDALEYFGLVERVYLTQTAVQFSTTEFGYKCRAALDKNYAAKNAKQKGEVVCLKAA